MPPGGNFAGEADDYLSMDCDRCRAAISAQLDGEEPGLGRELVESHLAECAGCRDFATASARMHRMIRVTPAEPVPDLSESILAAIDKSVAPAPVRTIADERTLFLRICLAVVAVIQLGMAVPALVLGDDAGLPTHVARHLGSFSLALGVGLLVVAWRPDRAAGVLPVSRGPVPARQLGRRHHLGAGRAGRRGESRTGAGGARRGVAPGPLADARDARAGATRAWMTARWGEP